MLRTRGVNRDDDDADDADDDDVMMMMTMMMMTLMKLVNSATKFRHGMDKFYQPNSGLRGSKSRDEAAYTYTYTYMIEYDLLTRINK